MGWSKFKSLLVMHGHRYLDRASDANSVSELLDRMKPHHYGFRPIRLGPNADGGYVVPDIIHRCDVCLSAGVADSIGFELDLFEKFAVPAHLADYSVSQPPGIPPEFSFTKKFLASYPSATTMTLDEWIFEQNLDNKRIVLQMDIEGAEYETLLNISYEQLRSVDVLVLEIHGFERILSRAFYPIVKALFDRLLTVFNVFHLHPNNAGSVARGIKDWEIPSLIEITFVSKELCRERIPGQIPVLPLSIDYPNKPNLPDIKLGSPWV